MPILDKQSAFNATSGTDLTVSMPNVAVGDLLIACIRHEQSSTTVTFRSDTGTADDVFSIGGAVTSGNAVGRLCRFLASTKSGTVVYRLILAASRSNRSIILFRAGAGHSGLHQQASNFGALPTGPTCSITTTAPTLVVASLAMEPAAGTLSNPQINGLAGTHLIVSGTQNHAAAWAGPNDGVMAAFTGAATINHSSGGLEDWALILAAFDVPAAPETWFRHRQV